MRMKLEGVYREVSRFRFRRFEAMLLLLIRPSPVRIRTLSKLDTLSTRGDEQKDEWQLRKKSILNVKSVLLGEKI